MFLKNKSFFIALCFVIPFFFHSLTNNIILPAKGDNINIVKVREIPPIPPIKPKHIDMKEVSCLAKNIYFEARNQPLKGKRAVSFVVFNRMKNDDFPDSVCSVVYQKDNKNNKTICQFSWVCENHPVINDKKTWNECFHVAFNMMINHNYLKDPTKGALYYHTKDVFPDWEDKIKTVTIKDHIFFKDKEDG